MALRYTVLVDDKGNAVYKRSTKNIKKMGKAAANTGAVFKGVFASAAVIGAIRGLGRAISAGAMAFGNFEKEMSKVKAISGANTREFAALEKKAKDLGKTTMFSAGQSAAAFTELSKMGFKANETIAASEGVLNLAAIAQVEMAEAATTAAGTLRGFGLDVSETNRVVDVMATSFTSSALDNEKWTESMKMVAPVSRLAGVGLEETAGALSVLADRQIAGSLAGTGMRRVLIELASSSSKVGKVLGGASLETHSLGELLKMLRERGLGVTEMQDLFGKRAFAAASVLVDQADVIDKLTEKYKNSEGAAKSMAQTMLDNIWGNVKLAISALEGLAIAIIQPFSPLIQRAIKGFTSIVAKLAEGFEAADVKIKAISKAFQEIFMGRNVNNADQLNLIVQGIALGFRILAKAALYVSGGIKTLFIGIKSLIDMLQALSARAMQAAFSLKGIFSAEAREKAKVWAGIVKKESLELTNNVREIENVWGSVGVAIDAINKPLERVKKNTEEVTKTTKPLVAPDLVEDEKTGDAEDSTKKLQLLGLQKELRLALIQDAQQKELVQLEDWMEAKSIIAGNNEVELTKLVEVYEMKRTEIKKKHAEEDRKIEQQRALQVIQTTGMMIGAIGELAAANKASKEELKAIRTAEVVANTAAGIMSAFGQGLPFPIALAQAVAIGILGVAQIQRIHSEKMAGGGRVMGAGNATSDNIPALLSPDERVLSVGDVARLGGHQRIQEAIDQGGGSSAPIINIQGNVIGRSEWLRDELIPALQDEMERA